MVTPEEYGKIRELASHRKITINGAPGGLLRRGKVIVAEADLTELLNIAGAGQNAALAFLIEEKSKEKLEIELAKVRAQAEETRRNMARDNEQRYALYREREEEFKAAYEENQKLITENASLKDYLAEIGDTDYIFWSVARGGTNRRHGPDVVDFTGPEM